MDRSCGLSCFYVLSFFRRNSLTDKARSRTHEISRKFDETTKAVATCLSCPCCTCSGCGWNARGKWSGLKETTESCNVVVVLSWSLFHDLCSRFKPAPYRSFPIDDYFDSENLGLGVELPKDLSSQKKEPPSSVIDPLSRVDHHGGE